MDKQAYVHGTGRRKTAVAQVRLVPGGGAIIINGRPYDQYFSEQVNQQLVMKPLVTVQSQDKYNVTIKEIKSWNSLNGGDRIYPSDRLKLKVGRSDLQL